jgi:hypothetical protein
MVRIGSRAWAPAQITQLMVLIDEGPSAAIIAISLKRSIIDVRAKARNLGKQAFSYSHTALMTSNCRNDRA